MRIAFRVDGSEAIGTGHIVRCLTLADRLSRDGHACQFVVRAHGGTPASLIEARGYPCAILPQADGEGCNELAHSRWLGTSQARDAAETRAALDGTVDWLVVDHYALDHRWQSELRAVASQILVVDDIADRVHDCDLLLDQNLQGDRDRYAGLVPAGCRLLLGPRYALLAPRFAELRAKAGAMRPDGAVLVYFGGVDAQGATLTALDALADADLGDRRIDVVVGDLNPHRAAIVEWCRLRDQAHFHGGGTDMPALMAEASLAIGAAGTTTWERCCLGLPTILVTIAENQRAGALALAREGAAIWVGDHAEISAATLAAALRTLFAAPHLAEVVASSAARLVDGHGAHRVAYAMFSDAIDLRPAAADDCDRIWEWRNDDRTRRHSRDPSPVALETHRKWFTSTLSSPDRILLIGECEGDPVGVLRYDRTGDTATISVYLVPGREGRGEGARLIRTGSRWLASHWPTVTAIDAEILEINRASAGAFAAAGFSRFLSHYRCPLTPGTQSSS